MQSEIVHLRHLSAASVTVLICGNIVAGELSPITLAPLRRKRAEGSVSYMYCICKK
jgi:hypothetical protein